MRLSPPLSGHYQPSGDEAILRKDSGPQTADGKGFPTLRSQCHCRCHCEERGDEAIP